MALTVGFSTVDITPTGARQTIYHRRDDPTDERVPIADRLHVRATVLRAGAIVTAIVAADVLLIDTALRRRVMEKLTKRAPALAMLCATHTHSAPSIVPFRDRLPTPPEYLDQLADAMARAIDAASADTKPARIAFGTGAVDVSLNRRQIGRLRQVNDIGVAAGTVDPRVAAVRIAREDGAMGWLINFAAHPLTMSDRTPLISADYPGCVVRMLRHRPRVAHAQFLQGCAGNINPKIHGGVAQAQRIGAAIADAAVSAAGGELVADCADLVVAERTVTLDPGAYPATVQALRVGDVVFVALPGEVFAETGVAIRRRSGVKKLITLAYANHGEVGYIPTDEAIDQGGYEAVESAAYYGLGPWAKGSEARLTDVALETIAAVAH